MEGPNKTNVLESPGLRSEETVCGFYWDLPSES